MFTRRTSVLCLLTAATVVALAAVVDGSLIEHAAVGPFRSCARCVVGLDVTAPVVVDDLTAGIDHLCEKLGR